MKFPRDLFVGSDDVHVHFNIHPVKIPLWEEGGEGWRREGKWWGGSFCFLGGR